MSLFIISNKKKLPMNQIRFSDDQILGQCWSALARYMAVTKCLGESNVRELVGNVGQIDWAELVDGVLPSIWIW